MNKLKLIISITLILLVGVFAGSLGTRIYMKHQLEGPEAGGSRYSEDRVKRIMKRLTDDLRLDNKQQDEIRKIIVMRNVKLTGIETAYQPDVRKIYDRSFALIKEKLNNEQKDKLQSREEKASKRYNALYFKSLRIAQNTLPDAAALKDSLGLNETQGSQIAEIVEDQRARQMKIIVKYENTEKPDLAAVRSELTEVEKDTIKQLSGVLTEQQMTRYREMQ